jgi:hypothetical protein
MRTGRHDEANKKHNNIHFILDAVSYVFRHLGAIFTKLINAKESEVQRVFKALVAPPPPTFITKLKPKKR